MLIMQLIVANHWFRGLFGVYEYWSVMKQNYSRVVQILVSVGMERRVGLLMVNVFQSWFSMKRKFYLANARKA